MATTPTDVDRALPRARAGDGDALGVLWRAHQPMLLRYLRGRGVDDPEGTSTQVWIDVARRLHAFDGAADAFRRWLFTIAHRRAVDELRRASRRVRTRPLGPTDGWCAAAAGADEHADARDALDRAVTLVRHLPDAMRDAVLLRVVADLSVDATAEVMAITPGHVRVLVHRGLRRLEHLLTAGDAVAVTQGRLRAMEAST